MNRKGNRQHSPTPPKQKWQNIYLALCVLLGMLASCETEESFYQPRFPANNIPLTRQALFKPENFFAYTDSTLKAVISALRRVEEEKHFTAPFLLKYGIPLWNFTYQLTEEEETCIFVPLYRLDKPHCIDAIWLLHIKDGWMKFLPLKRDDELIRESDQVFIFDLLSYLVFGEENAQGLTFKPHAQTRSVITVTQCWDVYTGPKDQLEYSYTNCVSHSYWVDDALINNSNWNSEGGGSGDVWIGGGSSGGSGSSSGTPAGNIFKKEADQDSLLWVITENMTARIMEDLEANNLLHEMFHVFQTTQEPISSFKSSMMNREIEAHYAQYLFLQRSAEWTDKKQDKYAKSQRLRATTSLTKYVNQQGHVTTSFLDIFETYISNNVVNAFRQEGYDNYPFKEYSDITNIFPNIKLTTKNCDE